MPMKPRRHVKRLRVKYLAQEVTRARSGAVIRERIYSATMV
jgi:hypothetical protein